MKPERQALAASTLFQHLTPAELDTVCALMQQRTFPANTVLISAEQPGEVVYLILRGSVKIHIEQPDGADVVIALLGAGDVVGEMSLIDSAGRSANVVTQERTILAWMQNSAFQHCLSTLPAVGANLARLLSRRVRLANEQIQALASLDVAGRVARQVLAFAERYGQPAAQGTCIPLRLTQSDLAGLVGASRERVNQVIGAFKQRGALTIDRRYHITVLRHDILAQSCYPRAGRPPSGGSL